MKKVLLCTISWRGSPKEASRLIENGLPQIKVLFHLDATVTAFVAATFRLFQCWLKNVESKRTNQKLTNFPERYATLRNFFGFQTFVVNPLFAFLSFIGPLTKKEAILCSQLTL